MAYQINTAGVIDSGRQMHYRFHHQTDPSIYPQVHDFYEITLITSGCMQLLADDWSGRLYQGALFLLRPGVCHTRKAEGECSYINLAFPAQVVTDLFAYLGSPESGQLLQSAAVPPQAVLPAGDALLLQARLERLNLLPAGDPHAACMELRQLVFELITRQLLPALRPRQPMSCPLWLDGLLRRLDGPECLDWDLPRMAAEAGRTKECLCRSFKRYLGLTPTAYLNALRLNYAANLLRNSDQKVIDIAYAAGFQSPGWFYGLFRRAYGSSPLQYRKSSGG